MYVFFWVFPRRLIKIVVCRRFGTLYQFHLQRLDVRYELFHCFLTSVRLQVGCQLHDIPFAYTGSNA